MKNSERWLDKAGFRFGNEMTQTEIIVLRGGHYTMESHHRRDPERSGKAHLLYSWCGNACRRGQSFRRNQGEIILY